MKKIAVIGGGAAGMMAAAEAAKCGAKVDLYERNDRIGKKILMTGNGKCNLSNTLMDADCFYGSANERVQHYLERFSAEETAAFFEAGGLRLRVKHGGIYPHCEQASAVLDVFRILLTQRGVNIYTGRKVSVLKKEKNSGFFLLDNGTERYHAVILTTGGAAAPKTGSDGNGYELAALFGHSIVPVVPALVQLKCRGDYFKAIAGVRCDAAVSLFLHNKLVQTERGEVQFTDYGISGIPVFQLSRTAAYGLRAGEKAEAVVDFFPEETPEAFTERELARKQIRRESTLEDSLIGLSNKKINAMIIKEAGLKTTTRTDQVSEADYRRLLALYKRLRIAVAAPNSFDQAQVSAGGIPLTELTEHLESVKEPGLFAAGELVDVDGRCGGYNLQWAWTSGYIAARGAAGGSVAGSREKGAGNKYDTDQSA